MKYNMLKGGQLRLSVRVLLSLLALVILATGCQSRRKVKKTVKGKKSLVYQINTTGATDQDGFLYTSTLVDALGDEVDYNTVIDSFELTSLSVGLVPNAGNTAQNFRIQSIQASTQGGTKYEMVDLSKIPAALPLSSVGSSIINALLFAEGLEGLNNTIRTELVGRNPTSLAPRAIQFRLRGTNLPAGSRASVTLTLDMELTMEYTTCMSVPEFLFSDLPSCK
ncbi:hypothetical protein IC229_25100 [Spirosoma sp. BT702]|uniref:Uncharacterized protein n=1 Tax=Spirosoma profusum TaxID=2771354 RepID=A0A927AUE9_9BACT|nr:hypothetical protein [Spirosoma profusum]MBD2703947.1 hypothetical protein [Spirosoma profusum]